MTITSIEKLISTLDNTSSSNVDDDIASLIQELQSNPDSFEAKLSAHLQESQEKYYLLGRHFAAPQTFIIEALIDKLYAIDLMESALKAGFSKFLKAQGPESSVYGPTSLLHLLQEEWDVAYALEYCPPLDREFHIDEAEIRISENPYTYAADIKYKGFVRALLPEISAHILKQLLYASAKAGTPLTEDILKTVKEYKHLFPLRKLMDVLHASTTPAFMTSFLKVFPEHNLGEIQTWISKQRYIKSFFSIPSLQRPAPEMVVKMREQGVVFDTSDPHYAKFGLSAA